MKSIHSQSGQALVEGSIATVLLFAVTIATVMFLCDTYLSNNYKIKLGLVTDQTADYLMDTAATQNLDQLAQAKAAQLIPVMGLPMTNVTTKVQQTGTILKITVSGDCKVLPVGLPFLPASIKLSDTAAIPSSVPPPWAAWLQGTPNVGQGPPVYMPLQTMSSGMVTKVVGLLKCK